MDKKERLLGLTALKGLFIWIIVLHNTFSLDPLLEHIPGMAFIRLFGGSLGNSMFFILSGFLMSWGYRNRIRSGQITFGVFLQRRLKKLYPMYALSNGASLAVSLWQYGVSAINLKRIAFTALLLGGVIGQPGPYNHPSWFVPCLMVCYALFYAGTFWTKSDTAYRVFLLGVIAAGYYFSGKDWEVPFMASCIGVAYLNFFIGCALAEVYPFVRAKQKNRVRMESLLIFALLLSVYLMLRYGVEIISGGSAMAFSFVVCPGILYLAYEEGMVSRILSWKPLQFLGSISMGVFYWHLVLYLAIRHILGGMTIGWYGIYLLIVLFAGILTSRLTRKKTTV